MLIESPQNPLIKQMRALQQAKGRREQNAYLLEGLKVIDEAVQGGQAMTHLFVEQSQMDIHRALCESARNLGAQVYAVSGRVIHALADTVTPQGICAVLPIPRPTLAQVMKEDSSGLLVILDGLQDPGNVGTIIRTADAVAATGVLITADGCDPYSPKAVRACMGSQLHLPIIISTDIYHEIEYIIENDYHIAAAVLDGEDYYARTLTPRRVTLVIGNESMGVRPELQALATLRWRLPILGHAESLNAAVAAGILMYDLSRHMRHVVE